MRDGPTLGERQSKDARAGAYRRAPIRFRIALVRIEQGDLARLPLSVADDIRQSSVRLPDEGFFKKPPSRCTPTGTSPRLLQQGANTVPPYDPHDPECSRELPRSDRDSEPDRRKSLPVPG
jgi:hypothetical protein